MKIYSYVEVSTPKYTLGSKGLKFKSKYSKWSARTSQVQAKSRPKTFQIQAKILTKVQSSRSQLKSNSFSSARQVNSKDNSGQVQQLFKSRPNQFQAKSNNISRRWQVQVQQNLNPSGLGGLPWTWHLIQFGNELLGTMLT